MRAYVITEPGGPDKLELREVDRPSPRRDWVLIRNRAFGLNRSEWFTRRGDSPTVSFPHVLGIECVGEVVEASGGGLAPGQTVAAMMGGMGRQFDGSYAEYVLVPRANVFPLQTDLEWLVLGALPEMLQTVHGSLYTGLEIDRALELIGTTTLLDSLQATRRGGIVCMTGILGGKWTLEEFHPMGDVPTGVKLTSYSGEASDISTEQLQRYVSLVESGQSRDLRQHVAY